MKKEHSADNTLVNPTRHYITIIKRKYQNSFDEKMEIIFIQKEEDILIRKAVFMERR